MALNDTCLNIGATAMKNAITHLSLASADPGAAGTANPTSAARQPVTWGTVATGDFSLGANVNFTLGLANGAVQYVCFWSAVTGGIFYGSQALSGDPNFNSNGEYTITALTVNGQST